MDNKIQVREIQLAGFEHPQSMAALCIKLSGLALHARSPDGASRFGPIDAEKQYALVVLIGEEHGLPANLIPQSMLLDRLGAECKVAYGFELPYNFLGAKLSQKLGYKLCSF